jgi:hypothetical protein
MLALYTLKRSRPKSIRLTRTKPRNLKKIEGHQVKETSTNGAVVAKIASVAMVYVSVSKMW